MKRREFFKKSVLSLAALPVLGSVRKETKYTLTSTPPKLVESVTYRYTLYNKKRIEWIPLNSICNFEKSEPRWTNEKNPKLYWEIDIEVADIRSKEMTEFLTNCEKGKIVLSVNYDHRIELIIDGLIIMLPHQTGIIAYTDIEPFYISLGYTYEDIISRRHHANSQM